MGKPAPGTTPLQQAHTYGVGTMRRHILLRCAWPGLRPDAARGEAAWTYLKKSRLTELHRVERAPTHVFRTPLPLSADMHAGADRRGAAGCCVWYHSADPPVLERILQEHILLGKVVKEFRHFAQLSRWSETARSKIPIYLPLLRPPSGTMPPRQNPLIQAWSTPMKPIAPPTPPHHSH